MRHILVGRTATHVTSPVSRDGRSSSTLAIPASKQVGGFRGFHGPNPAHGKLMPSQNAVYASTTITSDKLTSTISPVVVDGLLISPLLTGHSGKAVHPPTLSVSREIYGSSPTVSDSPFKPKQRWGTVGQLAAFESLWEFFDYSRPERAHRSSESVRLLDLIFA